MKINLYRGHPIDGRLSMEIYAKQISETMGGEDLNFHHVMPELSGPADKNLSESKWRMRYLRYWRFPKQVRNQRADIHHVVDHGYAHLLPNLQGGKRCVTVHDLIPLLAFRGEIPYQGKPHRPILNQHSLSFVSRFDGIITPSRATAESIQRHLDIDVARISIIPPVIGDHFRPISAEKVSRFALRYALPDAQYWVMVSGQEFYKNHETSLAVVKKLREQGLDVRVLKTGFSTELFRSQVEAKRLSKYVSEIFLHDASELPLVYNFVDCLLFPSLFEGFGMPVAEAASCGTHVVASDRGSLPEIQDSLITHVPCDDLDALAGAVSDALTDRRPGQPISSTLDLYRPARVTESWRDFYSRFGLE